MIEQTFATVIQWAQDLPDIYVGTLLGIGFPWALCFILAYPGLAEWHNERGHRWFWPADRLLALVTWPVRRVVAWRRREKPTLECPHCGAQSEAGKVEPFGFVCRVWHKRLAADLFRCRHCGKESGSAAAKAHTPPGTVDAGRPSPSEAEGVRAWRASATVALHVLWIEWLWAEGAMYGRYLKGGTGGWDTWNPCHDGVGSPEKLVAKELDEASTLTFTELPPNEAEQLNKARLAAVWGEEGAQRAYQSNWSDARHFQVRFYPSGRSFDSAIGGGRWEPRTCFQEPPHGHTRLPDAEALALWRTRPQKEAKPAENTRVATCPGYTHPDGSKHLYPCADERQPPTRRDAGESEPPIRYTPNLTGLVLEANTEKVPYGSAVDPLAAPVTQAQLAESLAAVNRRIDEKSSVPEMNKTVQFLSAQEAMHVAFFARSYGHRCEMVEDPETRKFKVTVWSPPKNSV